MRTLMIGIAILSVITAGCGDRTGDTIQEPDPSAAPVPEIRPAMAVKETAAVLTSEPTTIPWKADFTAVQDWLDNTDDKSYNADIMWSPGNKARIQERGDVNWGKVAFRFTDIDFNRNPVLTIRVDKLDPSASWKVGVDNTQWTEYKALLESQTEPGLFTIDLNRTGWNGIRSFMLILIIEGENKGIMIDQISLEYLDAKAVREVIYEPDPVPSISNEPVPPGSIAWTIEFYDDRGWYDLDDDPSYMAMMKVIPGGKARITEAGTQKWGKVARLIEDVNFDRHPVLLLNVDAIDPDAAFSIGVDTVKWDAFRKLLPSTGKTGVFTLDLGKTGWSGVRSFHFIMIVEGKSKSFTVDSLQLKYSGG